MTLTQTINRPEYDFLMHSPLGAAHNILFVTYGGSYAYGTNIECSDIDIRGVCMANKSELLGLQHFEQFVDSNTDTTIYAFPKAARLFLACNPNAIEMLGCRTDSYALVSLTGRMLLDNAALFLSNRCINSFSGYAAQQLHRLENAIARDKMSQKEQEKHILRSCQSACDAMSSRYQKIPEGGLRLYVEESEKHSMDSEIFMDVDLSRYPLRDFCAIWNDLNSICKNYGNVSSKNRKKDDNHIAKHMMHLFRLNLMCCDLLETGKIVTYRDKDHDFLMEIRKGRFIDAAGQVLPEFYEALRETEVRLSYAKDHSVLPDEPDYEKVEDLIMEINRRAI